MGKDISRKAKKPIMAYSLLVLLAGIAFSLFLSNERLDKALEAKQEALESYRQRNSQLSKENDNIYNSMRETQLENDVLNIKLYTQEVKNEELKEIVQKEIEEQQKEEEEQKKIKKAVEKYDWKDFEMTHYTAYCKGCSGITFSGHDARESIYSDGMRVIATDRNVIPQGSIVEIKDGDTTFRAKALDIGSAIKGNLVDLLVEGQETALKLGRKNVQIRIIREGW